MVGKKTTIPLVTRVTAKNFRSLEDVDVKLGPLTVLVGPNASGKSNVVDVLRFVADAFRNGLDRAIADRNGLGAIRRWSAKGRPYDVEVGLEFQAGDYTVHFGFVLGGQRRGEYQVKAEYFRAVGGSPLEMALVFETKNGRWVTPEVKSGGDVSWGPGISPTELSMRWPSMRLISLQEEATVGIRRAVSVFERYCYDMRFFHVFPNEIRPLQKLEDPYGLQEHGGNLASVLRRMIKGDSRYLADLRDALGRAVPGVADLQVTQAGSYLVVKLKHPFKGSSGKGAWFDLAQESDGTLRILALLATLFQDPSPSFVAVEGPELTVHPGALAVLADYIKESALRMQILITTHSPELLDHLPIESLRAVESVDGVTKVGMVAEHQREAVRNELFSPGDLHRIEGLQLSAADRR
jgi:predicted ATPase